MLFHENRLPDDSHEISCLIFLFLKKQQNLKLLSAANYRWRLRVNCHQLASFKVISFYTDIKAYAIKDARKRYIKLKNQK